MYYTVFIIKVFVFSLHIINYVSFGSTNQNQVKSVS